MRAETRSIREHLRQKQQQQAQQKQNKKKVETIGSDKILGSAFGTMHSRYFRTVN